MIPPIVMLAARCGDEGLPFDWVSPAGARPARAELGYANEALELCGPAIERCRGVAASGDINVTDERVDQVAIRGLVGEHGRMHLLARLKGQAAIRQQSFHGQEDVGAAMPVYRLQRPDQFGND